MFVFDSYMISQHAFMCIALFFAVMCDMGTGAPCVDKQGSCKTAKDVCTCETGYTGDICDTGKYNT